VAHILRRRAPVALSVFTVTVAATLLVTSQLKPWYESTTRILMDNSPSTAMPSSLRDLLSAAGGPSMDAEMEKIKSRPFLSEVLIKAGLTKKSEPEELLNRIRLSSIAGGQILEAKVRARTPEEAAKTAETLANVYISYARQEADRKLDLSKVRLAKQRDKALAEKEKADADMFAFLKKVGVSDPAALYARRAARTLEVRQAVESGRLNIPLLENRIALLRKQLQTIPPTVVTGYTMNKDALIDQYRNQIADFKREREEKLNDFGPESLEIVSLDNAIKAREEALEEVQKQAYSKGGVGISRNPDYSAAQTSLWNTEKELRELRRSIEVNSAELQKLQAEQRVLAPESSRFRELLRRVEMTTEAYNKAHLGLIQIEVNRPTNVPSIRVLERARVIKTPVSPKPILNALMAVFLGGFLGVGAALLVEYFASDRRDEGATLPAEPDYTAALPQVGGVPLLAQVPIAALPAPTGPGRELPVPVYNSAAAEDAFREIGYCLAHRHAENAVPGRAPVVLLAGTRSDETTAQLAAQLAATLVRDGLRVTLVDADRAQPRLNRVFGKPDAPGIADVLAGRAKAKDILHVGAGGGLRFLSAGAPDDTTPATETGMRSLFDELGKEADTDIVVVSGPSVWSARQIGPMEKAADGLVLVTPSTVPADESVARARRLLSNGYQPRILGVVVGQDPVSAAAAGAGEPALTTGGGAAKEA